MTKERKGRLGFLPPDKLVCEMVEDALETRLKKIKSIVKDEVTASFKDIEGKVKEIEERMMVTFGKMQGEIEMMSHMEMKEDQTLLKRVENLETNLIGVSKEVEEVKAILKQILQKLQTIEKDAPKKEESDY